MKAIRGFFIVLWKLWYYLLNLCAITLLSPFLLLFLALDCYPWFYALMRIWGCVVFYGLGFRIERTDSNRVGMQSHLVVCNHSSHLDILITLLLVEQPLVFVGKKELARLPIFGFFYKRASILVDRKSFRSRRTVYDQVGEKLRQGRSVFMAPEGGIPPAELRLASFKDGPFTLAIRHQLPLLPITIANAKQRFPDAFFKGGPGVIYVHVHPPIETRGYDLKARSQLRDKARALIRQQLDSFHETLAPEAFRS